MKKLLILSLACSFGFLNAAEAGSFKNLSVTPEESFALKLLGNNALVNENGSITLLAPSEVAGVDRELLEVLRKQVTQLCQIAYEAGRRSERDQK